jgi:hypothetical protein
MYPSGQLVIGSVQLNLARDGCGKSSPSVVEGGQCLGLASLRHFDGRSVFMRRLVGRLVKGHFFRPRFEVIAGRHRPYVGIALQDALVQCGN